MTGTSKPKVTNALSSVEKLIETMSKNKDAYVDKNTKTLFVRVANLGSLAAEAKQQGMSVKVLGDLSDEFVSIGFRALIKIDDFSERFTASNEDFVSLSHECEMD